MTITRVGTGAIGNQPTAGSNLTLAYPTVSGGVLANDLLVICCINNTATVWATTAWSGFTRRNVQQSGTGAQSPSGAIFYKVAAGGESGNIVGTSPGGTSQGLILAYRGEDLTTQFDVADVQNAWGAVSAYNVPTQTASMADVAQLILGFANSASGSFTPPTTPAAFTEIADNVIASTPHLWVGELLGQGAGATGTRNLVRSAAIRGGTLGVMIRPAAGGATVFATAAGTQAGTGSAVAARKLTGTAAGTQAGTGTAVAFVKHPATAVGTQAGTGTAAGKTKRFATAAGTQAGTGTAAATTKRFATAVGTQAGTGTAAAHLRWTATASGTQAGTGSATAARKLNATAVGTQAGTGSAAAAVVAPHIYATATGTQAGTGTALGRVKHPAAASSTGAGTGSAVALVKHSGTAAATGGGTGGVIALVTVYATASGTQAGTGSATTIENPYKRVPLPDPGPRVPIDAADARIPWDPAEERTPTIA